jgi:hypothetical protein
MILLADEVEFRPRRLMALEAIEPQEVVNFLRSLRAPESSVSPSNNKIAIKIAVLEPHDGLPIGNA